MRTFACVVNPHSGGGAAPDVVVPVARLLRDAGAEVSVTYSPGPEAMAAIVAESVDRGEVVVAVGGDGMLSSVAGLVARREGTLALLPAGRGNDFSRMLGLPETAEAQARLLLEGATRTVDLLSWQSSASETKLIAGSVYAGVDAQAAAFVDRLRWMPEALQYPFAAVRAIAGYRPATYDLVLDGEPLTVEAATVVVANSAYYGSGMRIAPDADIDDGLADVVIVAAATRRRLMTSFPKIYDGSHKHLGDVTIRRARRVEISSRNAVTVGGDGEPLGELPRTGPAVVEVQPAALTVIA